MSEQPGQTRSEGPVKPGDNPNTLNAKPRQNVRPRRKNAPAGQQANPMRLGWIDPLPSVNVIYPLGLEPNPEQTQAGELELDIDLPETIARPFTQTITSVGDRIQMTDEDKELCVDRLTSLSFFKAARQLYSTMLDHEKAANQPLKSVFYDETPIPTHMAGAIGMIGHMDTKVGKVLVRDAGVLFKRWIARGLQISDPDTYKGDPRTLVWSGTDDLNLIKRLARERIDTLVKQTYDIEVEGNKYTVSMPQLTTQTPEEYFKMINDRVPSADELRRCVTALLLTPRHLRTDDNIPNDFSRDEILSTLGLTYATDLYEVGNLREAFEAWCASYITDVKWRVESVFKVGPPPAGTTGYGAQTVSASGNTARWQFPLSDADVNIGYLFSPMRDFKLYPRMVGYSRRDRSAAAASFAAADGRAIVN